jgi:excinuclease ABC subunit C
MARRDGAVEIRAAERGDKRRILELAERNAKLALDQERLRSERRRQQRVEALDGLQAARGLDTIPLRIECFDISTLMGTNTVAAMVVFEGGAPKKSDYRRFKVFESAGNGGGGNGGGGNGGGGNGGGGNGAGTIGNPDDFAAMEEVLGRRLRRWERQRDVSPHDKEYDPSFAALPNVIVIDGGKGQLSAAYEALGELGLANLVAVGIAKKEELLYTREHVDPIALARNDSALLLVQRMRDEAHRFAVTFHRQARAMRDLRSELDEVPGVGPRRRRALLTKFGSVAGVRRATREELAATVGAKLADAVLAFFASRP